MPDTGTYAINATSDGKNAKDYYTGIASGPSISTDPWLQEEEVWEVFKIEDGKIYITPCDKQDNNELKLA